MKLSDVIAETRRILQDINEPVRYSDELLLGFANQALKRMAIIRPDLFAYIGELPTTAGTVIQSAPSDSLRIIEILYIKDGNGITEVNRDMLDETYPAWMNDAAAPTVNWMRHVRNPNKFFVYPKAPEGQVLIIEYAKSPSEYAAIDDVEILSDAYFPIVVDGTVYLAESIDNEHVNSNRAQLFQQSFTQALGAGMQARVLTDIEDSGLPENKVR